MGVTLKDIGYSIFFITHKESYEYDKPEDWKLPSLNDWIIVAGFLPFWFRFWQCINKYYYTRNNAHLRNAGKYFSKLIPPFITWQFGHTAVLIGHYGFTYYIIFNLIATIYCMTWDYIMDWGLFRSKQPGKYGLRDKLKFKPKFYYFAIVCNFLLRFFWIINIINFKCVTDPDIFASRF